jgi:hypothetical protein
MELSGSFSCAASRPSMSPSAPPSRDHHDRANHLLSPHQPHRVWPGFPAVPPASALGVQKRISALLIRQSYRLVGHLSGELRVGVAVGPAPVVTSSCRELRKAPVPCLYRFHSSYQKLTPDRIIRKDAEVPVPVTLYRLIIGDQTKT